MKNMKSGIAVQAGFHWSPQRWFGLRFPWSPEASEAIVPSLKGLGCAAWDSQSKTWWLPEQFYPHLEGIVCAVLGDSNVSRLYAFSGSRPGVGKLERPTWRDTSSPYATLGLIPQASDSVVKAAFQALSRELDPDSGHGVGGSYEPLEKVRAAFAQIKEERGL